MPTADETSGKQQDTVLTPQVLVDRLGESEARNRESVRVAMDNAHATLEYQIGRLKVANRKLLVGLLAINVAAMALVGIVILRQGEVQKQINAAIDRKMAKLEEQVLNVTHAVRDVSSAQHFKLESLQSDLKATRTEIEYTRREFENWSRKDTKSRLQINERLDEVDTSIGKLHSTLMKLVEANGRDRPEPASGE